MCSALSIPRHRVWQGRHAPLDFSATLLAGGALAASLMLGGCATPPAPPVAAAPAAPASAPSNGLDPDAPEAFGATGGQSLATRLALYKVSSFDALPGWQQDNLGEAWTAFKASCKALERRPSWKPLCDQVKGINDPAAGRAFLEREFALLVVQNTDRSREGRITGYYEPLLEGRARPDARFNVPVFGVPTDLYYLDWKAVPVAQRKGVTTVAPQPGSRVLKPVPATTPGALRLDLRAFTLDTLDRRLRVRLDGQQALPYYSRADIRSLGKLNAPVLAWVDDPLALYAMQMQGTGRIRLADGSIVRMQYADQNGQAFKPLRMASASRIKTRGAQDGSELPVDVEQFTLAESAEADSAGDEVEQVEAPEDAGPAEASTEDVRMRGRAASAPGTPNASTASGAQVDAMVQALMPPAGARPATSTGAGTPSARKPAKAPSGTVAASATPASTQVRAEPRSKHTHPALLDSDPSYVFFRAVPDRTPEDGPVGALGVPLTTGRSLAVDPRVLPLGYPVFLDAVGATPKQPRMQRLMFAQDTGGAIRGAVRADYFCGFGADAGRKARGTQHKGRMWVMVPQAEVAQLVSSRLVTRGGQPSEDAPDCLIDDEALCSGQEADAPNP